MQCHSKEEKDEGLCECEDVEWKKNSVIVKDTKDGSMLFDAMIKIQAQAEEESARQRNLKRQEAYQRSLREIPLDDEFLKNLKISMNIVSSQDELSNIDKNSLGFGQILPEVCQNLPFCRKSNPSNLNGKIRTRVEKKSES